MIPVDKSKTHIHKPNKSTTKLTGKQPNKPNKSTTQQTKLTNNPTNQTNNNPTNK